MRVRASYKEIFRAPTFNENYFFHYGSPTLNPERTQQLNMGLTWATDSLRSTSLQATVDGYYNHVHDMIVAVPFNMFVWTCINVGKVRVLGLDATLKCRQALGSGHVLSLAGNYTYQQVQNRTNPSSPYYNNQIAYTPLHSGSLSVAWQNPWANLSLHVTAVSERWSNNQHLAGTSIDGYYDLGLTAWRQFRWRSTLLQVRYDLKNLTSRQYEIVRFYPMPQTSHLLTLCIAY